MICIICFEEKKLIETNCNHFFCRDCIHHWSKEKRSCPICRRAFYWNVEKEFLYFMEKNKYSNLSIKIFIEEFVFYYKGNWDDSFSSIQYIFSILDFKDKKEYNFQNIINAIRYKYHHRYIFYIFSQEIIRYYNKSFLKKIKNFFYSISKRKEVY